MTKIFSAMAALITIAAAIYASMTHFATAEELREFKRHTQFSIEMIEIQRLSDRLSELLVIPEDSRTATQKEMILFYEAEIEKRKEKVRDLDRDS